MEDLSLFQLHDHIKRVFLLNFDEPVWVRAEILSHHISKGHHYLQLIQQNNSGEVIAQSSALIWSRQFGALRNHYGETIEAILQEGSEVKLKCQVHFDHKYNYSLHIQDIDLEFTLGNLYLKRQHTLQQLQDEYLLDLNKELFVQTPVKKIAVLSSEKAAGWADFRAQLKNNGFGFTFEVDFYNVGVQGAKAEQEILNALEIVNNRAHEYDCAILLRGGGSKLDLSVFDEFEIAKAVALAPLPYISAIGHETDEVVLDYVSHTSVKTPTAAAEFIVNLNLEVKEQLSGMAQEMHHYVQSKIDKDKIYLNEKEYHIQSKAQQILNNQRHTLERLNGQMHRTALQNIFSLRRHLNAFEKNVWTSDPIHILDKGFSVVLQEGQWVKSAESIDHSKTLEIIFKDGKIKK